VVVPPTLGDPRGRAFRWYWAEAVPDHRPGWDAGGLVPSDPKIAERGVAAELSAWRRVIAVVRHGTGGVRGYAAEGRTGPGLRSTSLGKLLR
jgi:hypothetical protein